MPSPPEDRPGAGQQPPSPVSRARRVARARPAPSPAAPTPAGTQSTDGSPTPDGSGVPVHPVPTPVGKAAADTTAADTSAAERAAGDQAAGESPPRGPQSPERPAPVAVSTRPQATSRTVAGLRGRERTATAVLDPPDDVVAPPPASRAGRNLPAAIGVGLALGALIIVTLFVWRPSFAFVVGAAVLYGCYEVWKAFRSARIRISLLPLMVGSAAMLVAAWTRGPSGLVLAALITVLGVFVWRLGEGAQGYTRDAAASAFVVLYLPLLAGFALLLAHPHDGAGRVIAFVATVVCSDTGGYATGVLFGRHPLAPVVSKAKTWEGFAGSVLACSAAGVLFFVFTFHQEWWKGLLFGLAIVVTATLGDLGESMIKRDLEIKDMGSLLPGHGGVLDRLDSLLPCAVVAYLVLSAYATRG